MPHCLLRGRLALSAAAAALVIAASGLLAEPAVAGPAGVLVRGMIGPVETVDPQKAATAAETALVLDLFQGLVMSDAAGAPVPGAASSWTISPDGLTYSFTLRDGARWSTGDLVKAQDFVASFRRLFDPATGATEDEPLQVIKGANLVKAGLAKTETLGVEAPDEKTLVIHLETPTPSFIARLALPVALPVNVTASRKLGTDYAKGDKLVGNGAYQLVAPRGSGGFTLTTDQKRRTDAPPAITKVQWRPFDSAESCLAAFRSGDVDLCPDVPVDSLSDLKTELGASLHVAPYAGSYFYVFDTRQSPFGDARIRRALSLVIDRDAVAREAWAGGMIPAQSLVPPALGGPTDAEQKPLAARQDEARTLLKQAGFSPTKRLSVTITTGSGIANEKTGSLIAASWKEIGVDAKVEPDDGSRHFANLAKGDAFEVARAGWVADEPDALALIEILRSDSRFNYGRYANPLFDKLTGKAATEMNAALHKADLDGAEAILASDAPVIPLLFYASLNLVAPRVAGFADNPFDRHPSRWLSLAN